MPSLPIEEKLQPAPKMPINLAKTGPISDWRLSSGKKGSQSFLFLLNG